MRRLASWVIATALMSPHFVAAQDADALFAQASEAYEEQDFERAAELFAAAHQLEPSGNKRFNEAQSWRRADRPARAADAYRDALGLGLGRENEATAKRKLKALRTRVGRAVIEAPDGTTISVAHRRGEGPLDVHLAAGTHEVTLTFEDGRTNQRTVTVTAGQTVKLDVALVPSSAPSEPAPTTSTVSEAQWIAGWTLLATGAAGGIVAGILGGRFLSVLDDYEATAFVDTELEDEALGLRTATNAVAIAAGVIGATGIVLLLTAPSTDPEPLAWSLGLGGVGGFARLRW